MLHVLPPAVTGRKLRLFALACCERIETTLAHPLSRRAMLLVGRHAEGLATAADVRALSHQLMAEFNARRAGNRYDAGDADIAAAYYMTLKVFPALAATSALAVVPDRSEERLSQTRLVHCVFGNPFRPFSVDPAWLTSTVVALAEGIYAEWAFDRMPILADALQDAGCENADVLNHCRGDGPHVRGCWLVDLLTGRA